MSDKKDDELAGFRDFLGGESVKRSPGSGTPPKHAGFELLSFLELESSRLDKQLCMMEEKSYVLKNCDSYENINKHINREISLKHTELMRLLYRKDSPMMKSIRDLFNSLLG